MSFNENTRVKLSAILHLCRLGYAYLFLGKSRWDEVIYIFPADRQESFDFRDHA